MSTDGVWYFIQWFHYLALSLWIGSITFFSAVAAPSIHRSMTSRALAGELVGTMLRRLNVIEIGCCLFLLATSFLSLRFLRERQSWVWYLILVILLMGLLTSFYTFHLTPKMEAVKEKVPGFDTLAKDHPAKVEFNRLHRLYVQLMSLNLVIGLGVLYFSVVIFK